MRAPDMHAATEVPSVLYKEGQRLAWACVHAAGSDGTQKDRQANALPSEGENGPLWWLCARQAVHPPPDYT